MVGLLGLKSGICQAGAVPGVRAIRSVCGGSG